MSCTQRKILFCLHCILLCISARSQHIYYHFDNYSLKDGLPSAEVYSVLRDSRNYLWFATDHGICRYDGYSFKRIPLPDNTVFHIREDDKGNIWFGTYTGQFFYIQSENDKILPYKYNDLILKNFNNQLITDFMIGSDNTLYISFMVAGNIKIDPAGKITIKKRMGNSVLSIEEVDSFLFTSIYNAGTIYKKEAVVEFSSAGNTYSTEIKSVHTLWSRKHRAFRSKNGDIIAHAGEYLVIVKNTKQIYIQQLPSEILSIAEDRDGDLWICYKNGLLVLTKDSAHRYTIREHHLEGIAITSIVQDHEGGFWCTSLGKGVFYLRSKYLYFLSPGAQPFNQAITSMTVVRDSLLLMGTPGRGLFKYDPFKKKLSNKYFPGAFDHLFYDKESGEVVVLGSDFHDSSGVSALKWRFGNIPLLVTDGGSNCIKVEAGKYLLGRSNGIYIAESNKPGIKLKKLNPDVFRVASLLKDTDGNVLVANQYGLWKYTDGAFSYYDTMQPLLKMRITCMSLFKGNILCMGTRGNGLFMKIRDSIYTITEAHGLVNNNIKKIIASENDLLIVTNNGLSKIKISAFEPLQYSIINLSYSEGLCEAAINEVCRLNGMIYIATDIGLGFLNEKKEFNDSHDRSLPFHFSQIKINDQPVRWQSDYSLSYKERDITIAYTAISFRDPMGTQYRYRIIGMDTNWIYTTAREVRLTSMPYGKFSIQLQASGKTGNWSAIQSIRFSIQTPFWKTRWFMALCLVAAASLIYLWTRKKINTVKKREAEKTLYNRQIAEMQIRALRAQMNPHFTFNVMQSIQYYISHHDFDAARRYLGKFSKLMRTILDHSRFAYIELFDEISTLQDYLDLEKLRFEESFNYSIQIESGIDPHAVKIPTMLIQPYVENALKHGLFSKKNNARIDIAFCIKNQQLVCEISDNGIGRKKAAELGDMRAEQHIPAGTSLVQERIEALNKYYGYSLRSETLDLYDNDNCAAGTKVVLTIPLLYSHDQSIISGR